MMYMLYRDFGALFGMLYFILLILKTLKISEIASTLIMTIVICLMIKKHIKRS